MRRGTEAITHQQSAPTGDDAIREAEIGRPVTGAIEDQQLMFNEEGLGNYGTDAARTRKSGDGRDEMDEKDHEIAPCLKESTRAHHFHIVARKLKTREHPGKLAIRHGHL
jgi:hypothetical protein